MTHRNLWWPTRTDPDPDPDPVSLLHFSKRCLHFLGQHRNPWNVLPDVVPLRFSLLFSVSGVVLNANLEHQVRLDLHVLQHFFPALFYFTPE